MICDLDFTNNVCRAGVWVRKEALFFSFTGSVFPELSALEM